MIGSRPPLTLRPLSVGDEAEVRRINDEVSDLDRFGFLHTDGTWEEILAQVRRDALGEALPPDRVRADFLVAEVGGDIVGRTSIRYGLTPWLATYGGHIGYAVAPAHRRKGYATEILRQSLALLARAGIGRALVTCDDDNIGSAAVIEANGGVLENVVDDPNGPPTRRYWITLTQDSSVGEGPPL